MPKRKIELSAEQALGLELLQSGENIFLTGGAGSGKSFLISEFRRELDSKTFPILASTGAAAVIVGGRTFHSFFGLGILEGGEEATIARGEKDGRLRRRLNEVEGVIIDEVSMIAGVALRSAESLCRYHRQSHLPWGGLRVIVVGDFAQLPPVSRVGLRDWAFLTDVWSQSSFIPFQLKHNQRVSDDSFLDILLDVRHGKMSSRVVDFLNLQVKPHDEEDRSIRLLPLRDQVTRFNQAQLQKINGEEHSYDSIYLGEPQQITHLIKNSPIPEKLILKVGCRVMFVQNDPQKRWVNGTVGTVVDLSIDKISVLKDTGRSVTVDKAQFSLQNAEGETVASVINFPLILAYASTIHRSQGATLDDLWVDLSRLWEPGQAYVALSRLTRKEGLKLLGWSSKSFLVDQKVIQFYENL